MKEYALMAALIAAIVVFSAHSLGQKTKALFKVPAFAGQSAK